MKKNSWELFTAQRYLGNGGHLAMRIDVDPVLVIGLCQQRNELVSLSDYVLFIYIMGRSRNRFFNSCGRGR